MSKCESIDPLVTPYVDGELRAEERTLVDDHLHRCPPCHSRVAVEYAVRDMMRAVRPGLIAERASPNLHAHCNALARRNADASDPRPQVAMPPPSRRGAIRAVWAS